MIPINANALQNIQTNTQQMPCEGPKGLKIILDFSGTATNYLVDMLTIQQQNRLSLVQTLYIDLSGASHDLTVVIQGSGQVIVAKAGTQGYYAVLCPNPPVFNFTVGSTGDIDTVYLLNVPVAGVVWTV